MADEDLERTQDKLKAYKEQLDTLRDEVALLFRFSTIVRGQILAYAKGAGPNFENFPHEKVDSLVLAFNDLEKSELKTLYDQGTTNGLKTDEMQILNHEQCLELEPNVNSQVVAGFLCTCSHMVDPVFLTNRLVESATLNGVKLFLKAARA
jgi:L-2-hydroxyglutarate oxidase LhgO